MVDEFYLAAIAALLPLTACMLVCQTNPYHALIIRGIVGAVAALVYAILGAADVALTEALVGTMLSITLYAVAVRSSLSMKLGIVEDAETLLAEAKAVAEAEFPLAKTENLAQLCLPKPLSDALHQALGKHHLRLELVGYPDWPSLQAALDAKEIHATCAIAASPTAKAFLKEEGQPVIPVETAIHSSAEVNRDRLTQTSPTVTPATETAATEAQRPLCHLQTRVVRLYEILNAALPAHIAQLSYLSPDRNSRDTQPQPASIPAPAESQP